MKDGKIDFKSVGITIVLAIVGTCIGFWDFISQKVNIMNFLAEVTRIKPMAVTIDLSGGSTDLVNGFGFGGIAILVMVIAIVCIAFAMLGIRGMA
jgi:hypothetical protein